MDATLLASLERFGSTPRLARYIAATTSDLEAITLYFWNIQLAESLIPVTAILEVTLRNVVHDVLTYWENTDYWFPNVLHPRGLVTFQDKLNNPTRELGHAPTSGKLVSEMTFGFWSSLFTHYYHSLWWHPPTDPPIAWLLPNHPNVARDTRTRLAERLNYFRELRNRMMHHEAIFDGVVIPNKPRMTLVTLERQMVETIGWLDGDAAKAASLLSRFHDVNDPAWKANLQLEIKRAFNIP